MTKKIVAVLALCLFIMVVGLSAAENKPLPKPANKDAAKKMEKAEKEIKSKEFDKAQALLQEVIQLEPEYAPAYYFSGAIHRQKKELAQAQTMLEKAVQLAPDFAPAVNEYAFLLSGLAHEMNNQNQPDKAVDYYARILALPNLVQLQKNLVIESSFNMGISAFQGQKYDKAYEAFTKLLAIPGVETDAKPNWVLAHYMAGICLNFLNKPVESTNFLLKYLELTSADPATQFTALSSFLVAKNEYSLLDAEVTKARSDTSATTDLRTRVQDLAKARAKIPEMLQKALSIKADLEDAYVVLGNYYYLARDLDQAISAYKTVIEKFPATQSLADYQGFLKKLEEEKNPPPPPPPAPKAKSKKAK